MNNLTPIIAVADSGSTLTSLDWLAIACYFSILLGVAWWVVKRSKDTAADYFLAGRNLSWWIIGASIFASNIGSEHIVGLAGSGAQQGVTMAHYELHAWCLLVLAWVFVPFYARSLVFTMPEFLERRFSPPSRYVLSVVSLITFVVTKIAVGIYAGGVVFATLLPEMHIGSINSFWIGSVAVIALTGLYTALGGMRAVAYNDAVQVTVLIGGSALLTFYGLHVLGGWGELRRVCGSDMFNLWKPFIPHGMEGTWEPVKEPTRIAWYFNGAFPWVGMAICAPVIGLWYWCTDQYIVQRALGAPNEKIARQGSIFAAFLKLFPVYLFIIPGLICFALAKSGKVPGLAPVYDPVTGHATQVAGQAAFPMMVKYMLPAGLRGIVVAGLLSALMGSLAGVFNACSTLFTVDLYQKWKPQASQHELVRTGRTATIVLVLIAFLGSGHPGRRRLVWLLAIRSGLPGPARVRGVLLRRILEAPEREGRPVRNDRRFRHWAVPDVRRHPRRLEDVRLRRCRANHREGVSGALVPLDRQQHQFPILQHSHHHRVRLGNGAGELYDRTAEL